MDLEVPIELNDFAISSNTTDKLYDSSRTRLDTGDYDGSPQYFFEVVASNSDSAAKTMALVDSSGTELATVSVPASTTNATRIRSAAFTPTAGLMTYRLKIYATTSNDQAVCRVARIIIRQTAATKTRIQIPLVGRAGSSRDDTFIRIDTTTSMAQSQPTPDCYSLWYRYDASWADYAATNPFTLEAVLSNGTSGILSAVQIYNVTDAVNVPGSEANRIGTTPDVAATDFAANAMNFADQKEYQLTVSSGMTGTARLHKACLYIRLTNLSKANIYHRIGVLGPTAYTGSASNQLQRSLIDLSHISNPAVYYTAVGREASAGDGMVYPLSNAQNDSNSSGGTNVANAGIAFDSATLVRKVSPLLKTTNLERFTTRYELTSGNIIIASSLIMVRAAKKRAGNQSAMMAVVQ